MGKHIIERIREIFLLMQDLSYIDFHSRLMPDVDKAAVIGVRVPELRKYVKELARILRFRNFWINFPHQYYEENNVHGFLIQQMKEYEKCMEELEKFLPYINNWATCDMTSPKVFKKHKEELLEAVRYGSRQITFIRFGMGLGC